MYSAFGDFAFGRKLKEREYDDVREKMRGGVEVMMGGTEKVWDEMVGEGMVYREHG